MSSSHSALLNALEKIAELLLLIEPDDAESIASIQEAVAKLAQVDSEADLDSSDLESLNAAVDALATEDAEAAISAVDELQSAIRALIERIRNGANGNGGRSGKRTTLISSKDALIPVSERSENVDDEMFAEFLLRTQETMDSIESDLLTLHNGFEQEAYRNVLRQIHTLKGDTGFLGFSEIERVCHATETALNENPLSSVLDMLFEVKDWLVSAFQTYEEGGLFLKNPKVLLDAFQKIGKEAKVPTPAPEPKAPVESDIVSPETPAEELISEAEETEQEPEELPAEEDEADASEAEVAAEGGHPIIDPIIAKLDGIDTDDMTEVADVHGKLDELLSHFASEPALAALIPQWQDDLSCIILSEAEDPQAIVSGIRTHLLACKDALESGVPLETVLESDSAPPEEDAAAPIPVVAEAPSTSKPAPAPKPAAPRTAMSSHDSMGTIEEGTDDLIGEFVSEANEHLENADTHLLTIETDPQNSDALDAVFRAFHTIKGVSGFLGLSSIQHLGHEAENLLVMAREGHIVLQGELIDAIFESVDQLRTLINDLPEHRAGDVLPPPPPALDPLIQRLIRLQAKSTSGEVVVAPAEKNPSAPKLGEILVDEGVVTKSQLDRAIARQNAPSSDPDAPKPKLGEALVKEGVNARTVAKALRSQKAPTVGKTVAKEYVKIDSDRLNTLVDMIGELVIAESMVSLSKEMKSKLSPELGKHLNQLDKITRDLQEIGTSLRMVPVKGTFQKMARIVRDLAKKSGKDVDLILVGEDTELDKTLVDTIGDPLVHMVRNAVDHGLEANADERIAAGKSPKGRVELRAFHRGGNIFIEIEDDGRGLNRERIVKKALENGLISDGKTMDDTEVFKLIFAAGFSTAEKVTEISGRGVGMDVVRRNIENLRGNVDIKSEFGKGTIFSIRLPLTLAIIDGMIVKCGPDRYVVPTLSVRRLLRPKGEDATRVFAVEQMLNVEGELVPLYYLGDVFGVKGAVDDFEEGVAIVIEANDKRYAIVVDEVLGKQQTVIKPLRGCLANTVGLSGGAILSDGQVGLIIDVGGVIRLAQDPGLQSQTAV